MKNLFQKTMKILFIFGVVFLFQNGALFAQTSSANIDISISPKTPGAGDSVTIQLSSNSIDLDTTKITWYVDGVPGISGNGQKSLAVTAKAAGETTNVRAVVETADGTSSEVSTQITPAGVALIVEPTSYVPPFYKGRSIFTNQGTTRVVAIPNVIVNGTEVSSKNLVFNWQQDGVTLTSDSGLGKDSVTVDGGVPIKDINISVSVLDTSGNILADSSEVISASDPKVLVYENSPLYGMLFNKAITGDYYLGQKNELDLVAKPYFFNLSTDSGSDSTYKWLINDNYVTPSGQDNELLLKQTTTNLSGTAAVSITINNNVRIFQYATVNFNVNFGI